MHLYHFHYQAQLLDDCDEELESELDELLEAVLEELLDSVLDELLQDSVWLEELLELDDDPALTDTMSLLFHI